MAKPALSLLFFGFYLVLVMSTSSEGVNALRCELSDVPVWTIDICMEGCQRRRKHGEILVSFKIDDRHHFPGCECCYGTLSDGGVRSL
ncbi:hypothetical protein C5167_040091 [Papaver somniferum]|uniref:Uncharacterized protein n=1 Tax=Papaver somniferum TaxID=3469 RepID=A0A4Y7IHF1_PAPSO|nr:hypothetical protein C5167_040091 [Papaver somniferum]